MKEKKIVQKFVLEKSYGQAAYLPSLFSIDSQLSKERKNNFQSNFSRGFYLVPKCIEKKITVALVEWGRLDFVWKSKPKQIAGKIDFRKLNHQFHKTFVDNQGWLTKGQIASSSYKKDEQKASIF